MALLARIVMMVGCLLMVTGCASIVPPSQSASSRPVSSPDRSASVDPAGSVSVVLGLYSGRPDPEWTLSTDEAVMLQTILAALPDGTGTPPVGGLGYHGFTIQMAGSPLVAYRGVVAPPGDGARKVKEDPKRSVERYLLETSRAHLSAAEFGEVERALLQP